MMRSSSAFTATWRESSTRMSSSTLFSTTSTEGLRSFSTLSSRSWPPEIVQGSSTICSVGHCRSSTQANSRKFPTPTSRCRTSSPSRFAVGGSSQITENSALRSSTTRTIVFPRAPRVLSSNLRTNMKMFYSKMKTTCTE